MNGRIVAEIQGLEMDNYYCSEEIKKFQKKKRENNKQIKRLLKGGA